MEKNAPIPTSQLSFVWLLFFRLWLLCWSRSSDDPILRIACPVVLCGILCWEKTLVIVCAKLSFHILLRFFRGSSAILFEQADRLFVAEET